jgi:hypothetical protein
MGIKIQIIAVVLGITFFFFIAKFIKKKSFNPSYSVMWILVSLFLISIPIFQNVYQYVSHDLLGLDDARHIIYIALIGFLLIFNFYITTKLTKMSDQVQILITNSAILENKIEKLKEGANND